MNYFTSKLLFIQFILTINGQFNLITTSHEFNKTILLLSTKYKITTMLLHIFAEVSTYFLTPLFDWKVQSKLNIWPWAISDKNQTTTVLDGLETKWQIKFFLPCFGRKNIRLATQNSFEGWYIYWSYVIPFAVHCWCVLCTANGNPATATAAVFQSLHAELR